MLFRSDEFLRPDNRTCDQLGEETEVETEIQEIPHRFDPLPKNILLEGSGRDPRRGGGVVVVLVDGLGLELLRERRGHAPTLHS